MLEHSFIVRWRILSFFLKRWGMIWSQEHVSSWIPENKTSANGILALVNKRQLWALVINRVGYEFCRWTSFQSTWLCGENIQDWVKWAESGIRNWVSLLIMLLCSWHIPPPSSTLVPRLIFEILIGILIFNAVQYATPRPRQSRFKLQFEKCFQIISLSIFPDLADGNCGTAILKSTWVYPNARPWL